MSMKNAFRQFAVLALAAAPLHAAVACYAVYDKRGQLAYYAQKPPVDMSKPIHQTLPKIYPGGHMVFDQSTDCPLEQRGPISAGPRAAGPKAPLLTNLPPEALDAKPQIVLLDPRGPSKAGEEITVISPSRRTAAAPAPAKAASR